MYPYQNIINISSLCYDLGIREAVLSPGSRVAPLILAFTRHKAFKTYSISDERSAAYIALGMSEASNKTVVLCCTSGTAVLNYMPAIAEAFYKKISLLVLTADRPHEWLNQGDGQTIEQAHIMRPFCKASFTLTDQSSDWHLRNVFSKAIHQSKEGPVHINIPFKEPFYPKKDVFPKEFKGIHQIAYSSELKTSDYHHLQDQLKQFPKILLVGGQSHSSAHSSIPYLEPHKYPLIGDITTNLHKNKNCIGLHDMFLPQLSDAQKKELQADLLISWGDNILSKPLKLFLRDYPAHTHWHIGIEDEVADVFQSLDLHIQTKPEHFFKNISFTEHKNHNKNYNKNYQAVWEKHESRARQKSSAPLPFGELSVIRSVLSELNHTWHVHLANSMSVRYINVLARNSSIDCFWSNRGTSGIDGCSSTAVGHSLSRKDKKHLLITGDLAFLYDNNAFWHNYDLSNLKILLLNNHAGLIFHVLPSSSAVPENDTYLSTEQKQLGEEVAKRHKMSYSFVSNKDDFELSLAEFLKCSGGCSLMEVQSSAQESKKIYQDYIKI